MVKTAFKVGGTLVSALITAFLNAYDIEEALPLFGFSVQWTFLTFLLFFGFATWWIASLESYKRQRENSKPNLVVFKKNKDEWQFYKNGQPTYHALQVWFVNNPKIRSDKSQAKDVTASVTFYDRNTKKKTDIFGCFTQAEVPDYATIKNLMDKIEVWSPNDIPQKLLIALKYPGDESAYGFAKSNFFATQDGRELSKEIKKGKHYIKITLKGIGVGQPPFWFTLDNPSQEKDLSISQPINKPNLRKEGFQTV